MNCPIVRTPRRTSVFLRDEAGVILPYVALLMTVLIAMGALAVDIGRQSSLQTQMQAIADALAVAGARELNRASDSQTRATAAINNIVANGISQLGYSGTISHTVSFYSALNAATVGGGTATTSQSDSRFVLVNVSPVSIRSIFGQTAGLSSGASAIAGFKGSAACGIAPVFICNPYETSGMTDTQATSALHAALDPSDPSYSAATLRKLLRLDITQTSPGHFGWLQPPNVKCNSTNCLTEWVSRDTQASLSQACYDQIGVKMATGNKPLSDALNDRFDIYTENYGPTSSYSPSINVRKGFVPKSTGNNRYCVGNGGNGASAGDALSAQSGGNAVDIRAGTATSTGGVTKTNASTMSLTNATGNIQGKMWIVSAAAGASLQSATVYGQVNSALGTKYAAGTASIPVTITTQIPNNTALAFTWLNTPLPLDKQWNGLCSGGTCVLGNGDWDCANYWRINHSSNAPSGCTSSSPTLSRYDVYKYEISQAGNSPTASPISDVSGPSSGPASMPTGETGSPRCAIDQGYTPTYDAKYDQRVIYAAAINCLANAAAIGGGNSGGSVPVAGFVKFFLTQPTGYDNTSYIYGEMSGLVDSTSSKVTLYNQIQLYR